ncbi:MAG TPA: hypothetical protein VNY83_04925 [Solirubrobacterales bacterium]|jgi:hypothetical protein|nr:hypothetical protein [Solirubrobacterales bacterium]
MKKPGEWIATFNSRLKASRVDVDASTALDLLEVTIVDPEGVPTNIYFFDRVEAARLHRAVGEGLEELERAAIDIKPPHYVAGFTKRKKGGASLWRVLDEATGQLCDERTFMSRTDAEIAAAELNRQNR